MTPSRCRRSSGLSGLCQAGQWPKSLVPAKHPNAAAHFAGGSRWAISLARLARLAPHGIARSGRFHSRDGLCVQSIARAQHAAAARRQDERRTLAHLDRTHVPEHGGIDFLHIGCNTASSSPDLPTLFWWEGPDGSRLLTMYTRSGLWHGVDGTGRLAAQDLAGLALHRRQCGTAFEAKRCRH